jgi:nicotinamidase-related amidase
MTALVVIDMQRDVVEPGGFGEALGIREANDRGYECLVLSDCVGPYFPEFQRVGLVMIVALGGIFGWVAPSGTFLEALAPLRSDLEEIPS